ncbi:Putative metabolite transport protein YjhB [bacterium HR36]|nr:Putative metabolite transport protein YjhB [bacterium HR36]
MQAAEMPSPAEPTPPEGKPTAGLRGNWWSELTSYHWFVLVVAALGWLFDTMDQQLFVLVRQPALVELLGHADNPQHPEVTRYGGYATSIFIVGWATGGLVFGMFGDRWGRARTMMLTILMYSLFTGLSALSVGWWDFAIYRFLTGMGVGGEFAAGVALVAEVMPARARPFALGLLQALSAVGNMTAALIYWAIFGLAPEEGVAGLTAWRLVFLVGILPALLVVVIRRRLREPESWVRAREVILRGGSTDAAAKQLGDLREMFRDPRWRYHTFIGVALAFCGVVGLWGIGFWTPELVRSFVPKQQQSQYVFLTSFLQNLGAFFGIYLFSLLTNWTNRRVAFAIAYLIAWVATVMVFGFMTEKTEIFWMIPLLGFSTLMVFGGYAIYFPELYPTRLRSTGTGFCYNVARYIAALGPMGLGLITGLYAAPEGSPRAGQGLSELTWLSSLGSFDTPLRYAALTLSLIYLVPLFLLPFAPETKGKPLPE